MQDPEITIGIMGLSESFDRDDGIPVMYQALVVQKQREHLQFLSVLVLPRRRTCLTVSLQEAPRVEGRGVRLLFPIQSTPDNSNLQGKSKKVRVIRSSKKIAGSKEKKKTVFTVQ